MEHVQNSDTIKMTDEVKRELLGILPMEKDATFDFTPSSFSGVPEIWHPKFHLAQLSNESLKALKKVRMEGLSDMQKIMKNPNAKISETKVAERDAKIDELVEESLRGWDNLLDFNTEKPIKYTDEKKARLPDSIKGAIIGELSYYYGLVPRALVKIYDADEFQEAVTDEVAAQVSSQKAAWLIEHVENITKQEKQEKKK